MCYSKMQSKYRAEGDKCMKFERDTYQIVETSSDKGELLEIIRTIVPGTMEAWCLVRGLERNPAYDARLHLEVLCVEHNAYKSYEFVDYIIECAEDTELMKRLYDADVDKFGVFVAVNITEEQEIVKMYESGPYEVKRGALSNTNASKEFLMKVIEEVEDVSLQQLALCTLKEISST